MARSPIIGATAEDPGRAKRSLSYNNTGESTPEGIRTELTRRAAERGQQPKEQNIVKAQIVQERADRDAQRRERRIADITTPSEPRSLGGDPVIPDRAEIDREQERLEKLRLSGQDVRVGRPHLRRF